MSGDKKAGFSIFWADDGLDTGPILLQRECVVKPNDTLDELYNRFLYPEGIKAMVNDYRNNSYWKMIQKFNIFHDKTAILLIMSEFC